MAERISFRAHYERFPASVKGAFVLRAADGDPHQLRFRSARAVGLAGEEGRSLDLEDMTLEVAPNLDLFVPFELPIIEFRAGWYALECDVAIDAEPEVVRPGKCFSVPWPRATTRRGHLAVGKTVGPVAVDHVDCSGDAIKVAYAAGENVDLELAADGRALPAVEAEFDAETGKGRVTAYPVLRTDARLTIGVRGEPSLEITLL